MPLPKPLSELQQELRELLTEDLAGALKTLQQLLPPGSEKHRTVTTLLGKLNDTNKARLRGTIANGDLQLAYNQLRSDLLDLLEALEMSDFEASASVPETKKAKQGEILYRIPGTMPLNRETRCLVRIALDADAIVENITLDEHVTLKQLSRVSELMQVELVDPAGAPTFSIRSFNSAEQFVEDAGYTEWLFQVTPLREGSHPLLIKVSVIELILGKERKKEIVLEELIQISAEVEAAAEAPLKSSGEALVFAEPAKPIDPGARLGYPEEPPVPQVPSAPIPSTIYTPPSSPGAPTRSGGNLGSIGSQDAAPSKKSRALRGVALFLVFLIFSVGTTWAVAPQEAAWVWTRYVQDSPEAYAKYAEAYPESRHREKAVFRKAVQTNSARDLQGYISQYPKGNYLSRTKTALEVVERRDYELLRQNPDSARVRKFIKTYPSSPRLEAIKQLVDSSGRLPVKQLREDLQQNLEIKQTDPLRIEKRQDQLQEKKSPRLNRREN